MANVKVAIRVRPLNARESADGGRLAVEVEDKLVRIKNGKLDGRSDGAQDSREKLLEFCFDYCYWSVDPAEPRYASQEESCLCMFEKDQAVRRTAYSLRRATDFLLFRPLWLWTPLSSAELCPVTEAWLPQDIPLMTRRGRRTQCYPTTPCAPQRMEAQSPTPFLCSTRTTDSFNQTLVGVPVLVHGYSRQTRQNCAGGGEGDSRGDGLGVHCSPQISPDKLTAASRMKPEDKKSCNGSESGYRRRSQEVESQVSELRVVLQVFQDLGVLVLSGASEGYNVCLFAYGQTGSGKTYTMMGTPGLFRSEDTFPDEQNSSRVEISFLEIYNERVRDLLRGGEQKKRSSLRVREHPEKGPYVQDLSTATWSRTASRPWIFWRKASPTGSPAATHNHDASSRSHAIFTIQYTQAILENNLPSETRADPHYSRDRLTEGSNINKSLVTLGIVISALAQNSQMSSSCQSINSMASEGDGSTGGSHSSSLSGGGRRHCFIPYRDSVLTWLLKDSLGGNSKTIMIATTTRPSALCAMLHMPEILSTSPGLMRMPVFG
ncbi:hypothetical protein KUCAC02_025979 [Chaenocephalus aceratus]|uniref:Uncharacterized protein n=1 Tax=Chaenocephalus aceratus TaxID=36190 RepID=A0ACB9VVJ9_CHAAC|nr:hypothetical protein KUCAC02_025979 [Chaenocephalus aceratus]